MSIQVPSGNTTGQQTGPSIRMPVSDQGPTPAGPSVRMPVSGKGPSSLDPSPIVPIGSPNRSPMARSGDDQGDAPISSYGGDVAGQYTQLGFEVGTPPVTMAAETAKGGSSRSATTQPPLFTSTPLSRRAVGDEQEAPRGSPPRTYPSRLSPTESWVTARSQESLPLPSKYLEDSKASPSLVGWLESFQSSSNLDWSPTALTQLEFPSVSELGSVASATRLSDLTARMGVSDMVPELHTPVATLGRQLFCWAG